MKKTINCRLIAFRKARHWELTANNNQSRSIDLALARGSKVKSSELA